MVVALAAHAELPVPALAGRVNDGAGVLSADERQSLESQLAAFEQETSHQIVVLTVPSLEGEPIESFSLRVVESWKLGHKGLDNGALLLVAPTERRARIEVGYGLEGVIPDAIAKRILEDEMFPHFRAGDAPGGVAAGVDALMRAARGEVLAPERRPRVHPRGAPIQELLFAAILGSFFGRTFGRRRWLGAGLAGLIGGGVGYFLIGTLLAFGGAFALAFVLGLLFPAALSSGRGGFGRGGGFGGGFGSGGGLGGGGFGGGGLGGGGGGFGGGGASGSW